MTEIENWLNKLHTILQESEQRYGIVLSGSCNRKLDVTNHLLSVYRTSSLLPSFQLGGSQIDDIDVYIPYKKGAQFLGQECSLLVCDLADGFDANSFNSVLGTLVKGGLLLVLSTDLDESDLANQWLKSNLDKLVRLEESGLLPTLPKLCNQNPSHGFLQQEQAVQDIIKVVEGHRKRPLLLTADRGRGKSSALGIAAAEIMQKRDIKIVVTAPSRLSVEPVFQHAARILSTQVQKNAALEFNQSKIEFASPDDVLRGNLSCDLLLVDEASAIPVNMLKEITARYHRLVFSTTIHGYEGCGRGFTLKFVQWLKENRAATRECHLTQPIRWREKDWLESWQYQTFLLNVDVINLSDRSLKTLSIERVCKTSLLNEPESLKNYFALLVSAHYQTSPNDLFSLLSDPAMKLYVAKLGDTPVACLLAVEEGGLNLELVEQIENGIRRPKGHLVATSIMRSFGLKLAATQKSLRVMRVAVHLDFQRHGIASKMLDCIKSESEYAFLSTSFGITYDLLKFWQKNQFSLIKIGSKRDAASGTHSALMVLGKNSDWLPAARQMFSQAAPYYLTDSLRSLEPSIVREMIRFSCTSYESNIAWDIAHSYARGGASYEDAAAHISTLIFSLPQCHLHLVSDLLISKVIQQRSFPTCAEMYKMTGRKQIEKAIKEYLATLKDSLQCKSDSAENLGR